MDIYLKIQQHRVVDHQQEQKESWVSFLYSITFEISKRKALEPISIAAYLVIFINYHYFCNTRIYQIVSELQVCYL